MKNGILATINQSLDPDTAELVVTEFGHKVKRVARRMSRKAWRV